MLSSSPRSLRSLSLLTPYQPLKSFSHLAVTRSIAPRQTPTASRTRPSPAYPRITSAKTAASILPRTQKMSLVNFSLLLVLQCLQLCVEAAQPEPQSQAQAHEAYKYRAATDQSILNGAQGTIGQSVRDELKNSEIISDVIDDFHPTLLINITYPTTNTTANLGNTITPSSAQDPPTIELYTSSSSSPSSSSASSPATNYTLVLTDPDAPSRSDPKWSEFCHWIITNVPLSPSSSPEKVSSTEAQTAAQGLKELIPYAPPAPPPKTGSHRYAFLAFAPKSSQVAGAGTNLTVPSDRKNWGTGEPRHGVRQWAAENGLVPVGGNFFYSANDEQ